jgi:hypothetical protein
VKKTGIFIKENFTKLFNKWAVIKFLGRFFQTGSMQNHILRAFRAKQFCYFESNPQNLVALVKPWFYVKGYFAKAT